MIFKARFAPSPTGLLHVGNARSAALNWAYINKIGGEFILRIDDTDKERSTREFEKQIKEDLKWLGITWNKTFNQSGRQHIYDKQIQELKNTNRIYPCFESPEELALKKKSLLSSGKPPIYDRSALSLAKNDISDLIKAGKKPHWRFKLEDKKIEWNDLIKGKVSFESKNLSDPILIREDGSLLYHLPSVIDDIEQKITDIIRGDDHITNTAFHIQLFEALKSDIPKFGHHPFLTDEFGKSFGKRLNSLSLDSIRQKGYENLTLLNYLLSIGTSSNLTKEKNLKSLISKFNIKNLSLSSPKFSIHLLQSLNKNIVESYNFEDVRQKFIDLNHKEVKEDFWNFIKNNINFFSESLEWIEIIKSTNTYKSENADFLKQAAEVLPNSPYNTQSWNEWTSLIKDKTGKKGKELFMPLRIALTGREKGPELKYLLPLLSREHILKKLGFIS
ncbi:glutamate--tRNA ligase [Alphaproteobacteria bacterium]|nr:glutamate--tRNA ligase [Alphaproteobacteria bacterium]